MDGNRPETYSEALDVIAQLRRDLSDCFASPRNVFTRCACGRLKSVGLVCPTNAEGGECEAGI